jgi:RimJ/RimL family protein N-acetyltransferase
MPEPALFVPIETARLLLRPFELRDAWAFSDYRSDPEVARYQAWEPPFSLESATWFIEELHQVIPGTPGGWYQVAVELKSEAVLIGDVGFQLFSSGRQAEIGFTLARRCHGKGFAFEAVGQVLDYLFTSFDLHRVQASCDPRNLASVRLLERLGMRREGHRIESAWYKGEWTDEYWYAILRREWQKR